MDYIKSIMPEEARELVNYFDQTYISGLGQRISRANQCMEQGWGVQSDFENFESLSLLDVLSYHLTQV